MGARIGVILALLVVLGVPFAVRLQRAQEAGAGGAAIPKDAPTLIVVTPHVEQIRSEFEEAFDRWHMRHHGGHARIDWRAGAGTSEILKMLEAQYTAAAKSGVIRAAAGKEPIAEPGTIGFDVMLGGGSYEHAKLARPMEVETSGGRVKFAMSVPAGFTQERLDSWYGENKIGAQQLYDPGQRWLGTALSGFGIVFNRDVLKRRGLEEPQSFEDLTDARYIGMLALADPRLSGSVTTTYESILNKEGWDKGWRILRSMCANARYFATSSTRPPVDVASGDSAAGLAIDFYGRSQAQAVMQPGESPETCRVGYVDPIGATYIDADPVSILLGAPNPDLASRFVEFCLSEEGQALWQFHAREGPHGAGNPRGEDGSAMGPRQYELRRMPVRRVMYEKHNAAMVDKGNPFEAASDVKPRGWRDSIAPMMGAFAIDTLEEQRAAWRAVVAAREEASRDPAIVPLRDEIERLFFAMPVCRFEKEGKVVELEFNEANYRAISDGMQRWGAKDPERTARARMEYTKFFKGNYGKIVAMWEARSRS